MDFVKTMAALDAGFAIVAGDMEAIGRLPPGRAGFALERLETLGEIAKEAKRQLAEKPDVDLELLVLAHRLESFTQLEIGERMSNPDVLTPLGDWLMTAMVAPFEREEERFSRIVRMVEEVPVYLAEAVTTFGPADALWLDIALEVASDFPSLFDGLAEVAKRRASPATAEALDRARVRAQAACKDFTRALRECRAAEPKHVLGSDRFGELLSLKGIPYDAREVEILGEERLAKTKEQRAEAIRQWTGYSDLRGALRAIADETPDRPLEEIRSACLEARDFAGERNLCPVPGDEAVEVMETPAFLRAHVPFAAVLATKPLWPVQRSLYYVTRAAGRADLRNTSVHEAYPGHHLSYVVAADRGSLVRNVIWTSGNLAAIGVETTEGWAHYAEAMMHGQGFGTTMADRVQVLNDSVWRALRMILDVRLATGRMTPEQAAQRLVDEVGMKSDAALKEARRYCLMPGYPLCYALGKHMIRGLRVEAERAWGSKYSLSRFHELVMTHGRAPLAWVRRRMQA